MQRRKLFVFLGLIILIIGALSIINQANALDTGWKSPSSGSTGWSGDITYAYSSDNLYIYATSGGLTTTLGGYGFTIPSTATISSVTVRIEAKKHTAGGDDLIKLEVSENGGTSYLASSYSFNPTSTSDLNYDINVTGWTTWTPAKINTDKIRVRVTSVLVGGVMDFVYVDWIPITVTYKFTTTTTTVLSASTITLGQSVTETATVTPNYDQVTYVAAGTGSGAGSGSIYPSYPSGLALNDLILLQVTVRDTSTTVTTPTGFTWLFGPDSTGTGRQWIFYRFSAGTESGTITITPSGAACRMARMYAFRNVALSSFTEGGGFGSGSGATISAPSVTTNCIKRLAVSFVFVNDDNAVGDFTTESGGNWVEATSEYTFTGTAGNDGCIQLQTATMASAGTISGGSFTMAAAGPWGVRAFALKPSPLTTGPTGTVTFYAKAPGGSWVSFDTKTLSAGSATSASYTPNIAGTWYFKAAYSGSADFTASESGETAAPLTVNTAVTFTTSGMSADTGSATILTIDGTPYTLAQLPQTFSWFPGTTHTVTAATSVSSTVTGKRYTWSSWTNPGGLVGASGTYTTPSSNTTVTANYVTQYYLNVSSAYGTPGGAGWYDAGTSAYATVTPLTVPGPSGTQYVFTHWSGDATGSTSPSNPITMNAPKTATANWKTQYQLTVTSAYSTPSGAGWYDSGSTAYAGLAEGTVSGGTGTQYVFTSWSGDASGTNYAQSNAILMNASKTATATWKTQYEVSFDVNPAEAGTTTPSGTAWYDEGETVPISASNNPSYAFSSWSKTGLITIDEPSSRDTDATINGPGTITANFIVSTQPTAITVSCDPETVDKMGNKVTTIRGTLTAGANGYGVSNKTITLYYKAGATGPYDNASENDWIEITQRTTNDEGRYSYEWDPPEELENGWYWIKAEFAGDADYYGSSDITGSLASNLFIIPEYLIGALSALGTCFAAFITFKKRGRKRK